MEHEGTCGDSIEFHRTRQKFVLVKSSQSFTTKRSVPPRNSGWNPKFCHFGAPVRVHAFSWWTSVRHFTFGLMNGGYIELVIGIINQRSHHWGGAPPCAILGGVPSHFLVRSSLDLPILVVPTAVQAAVQCSIPNSWLPAAVNNALMSCSKMDFRKSFNEMPSPFFGERND